MNPLEDAAPGALAAVRYVLTDMDDTLTFHGRLAAATYGALERLQAAGIRVIPVTAAPAGWCDQMARMWPVDAVIGENGGLCFARGPDGDLVRHYWLEAAQRQAADAALDSVRRRALAALPQARVASDQPFRQTGLAFARPADADQVARLRGFFAEAGADSTVNSLWVLGWLGGYDKLAMARRSLGLLYGVDLDAVRTQVMYVGDSTNDAPMFSFFAHTVGVSTVVDYLDTLPVPPRWITRGPGGAGFVEAAEAVLRDAAR
ncbi:HAD family hydrolase [Cupriavidus sp. USMAA2-4]|uniref:HAD-IIB family hydrolase n=1 Tax=Cupriavidus sp. USMAA2-4 TaxID=876364 RepID=UPI0008A6EA08|nr:HAD-IIB family hydrolase [Cupriavidus sp. USMAA2-4]AOY97223.1 HAD family hydrolase [Cupriavidus sp. USMAA2-4]